MPSLRRLIPAFLAALAIAPGTAAAQAPAGAAPAPAAFATPLAERWAQLQGANGAFPDSIRPANRAWGRYGEAGLGYGLMLAGLRTGRSDWLAAGARAQRYAIANAPDRLSVFESMLIASGYNLLRLRAPATPGFAGAEAAWEQYLRDVRPLFDADIDKPYLSSNKYLVEAVLGLELHTSGLSSPTPGTTLHVPGEARRRALHIVNTLVPHRVGMLRGRAAGHRTTALSDRHAEPVAYHALATGLLARALELAGGAARPAAHKALRIATRTLWAYQSPDGDVAYMGRSQGQAWALAFAALAADRAAGPGCSAQTRDFLAVGDRAMRRLATLHPVGPAGMPIVPSAAGPATIPALDDYAGDVVYNGLALTGLEWAARGARPRPGCVPDAVLGERTRSGAILPFETGRFAVLRRGDIWMAVKQRTQGDDARTAFGLRALKRLGDDGRWVDLLPAAPRIVGTPTTLGPALVRRNGRLALPAGAHLRIRRGRIVVDGGWITPRGRWVRRGLFRFVPTVAGARMVIPTRKRDRVRAAVLVEGRPVVIADAVSSARTIATISEQAEIQAQGPFASTTSLDVWRTDFSVRADGRTVRLTLAAAPPAPAP